MPTRSLIETQENNYLNQNKGNGRHQTISDKFRNNIPKANSFHATESMVDLRKKDFFGSLVSLVDDE